MVRLGKFKNAAVFNLVGGRLISRDWGTDWSMGVIESDTGNTTPTPLSWVDDSRSMPEFEYARENNQDVLRCGPGKSSLRSNMPSLELMSHR
ncbi:uncharacterized protein J4E87_004595 [Alternaria ethzedia]|uniref:uncharacterized protein n=1 Tax=Alternaria ethzedia TaxID=181014 RepID=UPI0020C1E833|nr:uncharacterized protein J4E87_004595 [Alternaria ethzedia]KAI4626095.1 hypothetical protein J4E87_004595 [Alternaria ethzedia]